MNNIKEPETEMVLVVHMYDDMWRITIKDDPDFPDQSVLVRTDDGIEGEPMSIGAISETRAVAEAMLKWCEYNENLRKSPV